MGKPRPPPPPPPSPELFDPTVVTTVVLLVATTFVLGRRQGLSVFAWECIGSALIVLGTCSPGPLLGAMGKAYEWPAFHVGLILTDVLTSAHVNPAVTGAFCALGRLPLREYLSRVAGQLAGGCIGWTALRYLLATCCGASIGGPTTPDSASTLDAAVSEGFAAFLLLCGICIAADSPIGKNYWVKMSVIAACVRAIITLPPLLAPTGPAINPMIATTFAIVDGGAWPSAARFYLVYWVAATAAGVAAVALSEAVSKVIAPAATASAAKKEA